MFTRGRVTAFARVGARGRVLDVEPSYGAFGGLFHNAGHATTDAGLSLRLAGPVELVVRVANLFDRRYEETFGFPAPGRSAMAGLRIAAGR
jgi:outer membrane receptor protein involved in Fe transport